MRWHDSLLNLDGSILIPHARISPRYLPSDSATESADLVIIGGEPVIAEESFFDRSKLRVNGSVTVELGKDITVTLENATARLHGKAVFEWDGNVLPMANGNYTLSGKISSYGQLLEVADGRVYFPHVPADDPHLNINAEREIYGNLQIKQAGVHITGTLKQPTLEPYTTPVTTRERALALLVTGHDFDYEQGVGGIEVGMYIAPRLYVSYGLGLFESQNVISARYDLKHGFGIKATSGQRETGADISYTIEH
jgi:translocation and assembly module TamB